MALQVVLARGTDRIPGREFPGACKAVINEDRNTHSLAQLYKRVIAELAGRPMSSAFEDVYQTARHAGLVDIVVDGKRKQTMYSAECAPFREAAIRRMADGAEQTIDHLAARDGQVADIGNLFLPLDLETDFQTLPEKTFEDFLQKADRVYYKSDIPKNGEASRRGIRWEHYSARDHEYGRPYVVVGSLFFARLARGIVGLSRAPWTWDEKFAKRWYARRQRNIRRNMQLQLMQNFETDVELPPMIGADEAMKRFRELTQSRLNDRTSYDHLHGRVEIDAEDVRAS